MALNDLEWSLITLNNGTWRADHLILGPISHGAEIPDCENLESNKNLSFYLNCDTL